MSLCYYEGEFRPIEKCAIPVTDLAIQRGVGVFDSIRLYDYRPFAMKEHLARLAKSATDANITNIGGIMSQMPELIREGCRQVKFPEGEDGLVRPFITGGDVNELCYFPDPRFFIIFEPGGKMTDAEYQKGTALEPTEIERPFPLVKSINYLFGFMPWAGKSDVLECLYCPNGIVRETLRSSFFICKDGKIITAPVGKVLGGVTRNIICELAREENFIVEERDYTVDEMYAADEAFVTSSWKEVLPVVRVGERKIGKGVPGPVAQHLLRVFRAAIPRWLDK